MNWLRHIILSIIFGRFILLFGNDCPEGTTNKEDFLGYDEICVPIDFSTVHQGTLQGYYIFYTITKFT